MRERGEEVPAVDDGAQVPGHAPAHGEGTRREAPEDVGEQLLREEIHGGGGGVVRTIWVSGGCAWFFGIRKAEEELKTCTPRPKAQARKAR